MSRTSGSKRGSSLSLNHKPRGEPVLYRPISLTSCTAKLLEKLINNRLHWFLEKNGIITKLQVGFRARHCTMDQVIRLETAAKKAISEGRILAAVFLDINKAYDETWLTGLLFKLTRAGVRGPMLAWLRGFLVGRSAQVCVGDALSEKRTLLKGVPQGAVLSPILFNVYMSDFPTPARNSPIPVPLSLFADDVEAHTVARTVNAAVTALQTYLWRVQTWGQRWKLSFSVEKSALLVITNKKKLDIAPPLILHGRAIPRVQEFKFLGMVFNETLTWKNHLEYVSRHLYRIAGLFSSMARARACPSLPQLIRIYKAMVRSKID